METLEAVSKRCTTRRFKSEPIPDAMLKKILNAARLAPSGLNSQPWEFIIVKSEKGKKIVAETAADCVSMIWQRKGAVERALENLGGNFFREMLETVTGEKLFLEGDLSDPRTWEQIPTQKLVDLEAYRLHRDRIVEAPILIIVLGRKIGRASYLSIGAAIENMLITATALGIGSRWMGAPLHKKETVIKLRRFFNVPENLEILAIIAFGYPAVPPKSPPKRSIEEITHEEKFE